jgi:4-hydroxy-tetrahydrodipicolinate reductase
MMVYSEVDMRIAVVGCNGRLGSRIAEMLRQKNVDIVGIDVDTENTDVVCDGVVDFSRPQALDTVVRLCIANNAPLVSGTTGYSGDELARLEELKKYVKVDYRRNFSVGVAAITEAIALLKDKLKGFDVEIVETHHKKKVDSPSGTAKDLAAAVTKGSNSNVTVHSLRGGNTVGVHSVYFFGENESIVVTHTADSVDVFAKGAVEAILELCGKE